MLELADMDAKENRRLQLLRIIKTRFNGNSGQCADALGIKRPQMSRWITGNEDARQGIAEESARALERKLGLPSGLMDTDPDDGHEMEAMSADDQQTLASAEYLPPDILAAQIKRLENEQGSRAALLAKLKAIQREGEAIEQPPKPPAPPHFTPGNTVVVSERRLKQRKITFPDRRKEHKNG